MTPYPGTCFAGALVKPQLAVNTCGEDAELTGTSTECTRANACYMGVILHVAFALVYAVFLITTPHTAVV